MNVPSSLFVTVPLEGSLNVKVSSSPSTSEPLKAIAPVAVSSSVLRDVVVEMVGASFTAATADVAADDIVSAVPPSSV